MVMGHLQASQALAAGIHSVPDAAGSFAATLAAHRFLNNPRISLPALAEPLIRGQAEPKRRSLAIAICWWFTTGPN